MTDPVTHQQGVGHQGKAFEQIAVVRLLPGRQRTDQRRGGERGRLTHFADVGVLRAGEPEPEAANGVADDPSQQYLRPERAR